jgi:hypothetical protein
MEASRLIWVKEVDRWLASTRVLHEFTRYSTDFGEKCYNIVIRSGLIRLTSSYFQH